jgi:hypothetical protein
MNIYKEKKLIVIKYIILIIFYHVVNLLVSSSHILIIFLIISMLNDLISLKNLLQYHKQNDLITLMYASFGVNDLSILDKLVKLLIL